MNTVDKGGIRFNNNLYVQVNADLEEFGNSTLTVEKDGETTNYDLDSGTGTFTVDLRTFPSTMTVGDTYQVVYSVADGGKIRFAKTGSYFTVSDTGLVTAVSAGAGRLRIYPDNSNDINYGEILLRIDVVAE